MIRINWWILKMGKFCVWIFHFIFLNRSWILKDFMYTKKICNKTNCTFNAALHTVLLIDWRCIGFWSATWFLQVSWEICLKVSLEMINLGKLSPSLTPHFLNPSHFRCPCIKSKGSLTPHALTPHPNFHPIHRKFHLMLLHLKLPDLVSYE